MRTVSATFEQHFQEIQETITDVICEDGVHIEEAHFSDDAAGIIAAILTLADVLATK